MNVADQVLFDRGLTQLEQLADALTSFQCATELAGRGNLEAKEMAESAKRKLKELIPVDAGRPSTV